MEVNNILDWRFQPTYIHCNHLVFIFIQINSSNKLVECLFVLFNTLIFLERVQPIIEVLHVIKRQELLLELLLLLAIATLCLCSTLPPKFYLLSLSGNSSFKVYGHQFNLFFPLGVITIINHQLLSTSVSLIVTTMHPLFFFLLFGPPPSPNPNSNLSLSLILSLPLPFPNPNQLTFVIHFRWLIPIIKIRLLRWFALSSSSTVAWRLYCQSPVAEVLELQKRFAQLVHRDIHRANFSTSKSSYGLSCVVNIFFSVAMLLGYFQIWILYSKSFNIHVAPNVENNEPHILFNGAISPTQHSPFQIWRI